MIECPELYTVSISPWCTDMRGSCSILLYWRIRFILRQYITIFRCLILKLKDDAHQEPHTFCLAAFSLSACPTAARASCKTLFFTVPTIRSEYSSLEQSSTWSYPHSAFVCKKEGFEYVSMKPIDKLSLLFERSYVLSGRLANASSWGLRILWACEHWWHPRFGCISIWLLGFVW